MNKGLKTWKARLGHAVKSRGIKPSALAKAVGVSAATVSDWINGIIKNIDASNALKVANALKINIDWLMFGRGDSGLAAYFNAATDSVAASQNALNYDTSTYGVPVISWVQAGEWCDPGHVWDANTSDEWRPCPVKHSPHTVAIVVRGDSMWPEYPEGVDIFVDPTMNAQHNDDVVVRDTEGKATLKRLKSPRKASSLKRSIRIGQTGLLKFQKGVAFAA